MAEELSFDSAQQQHHAVLRQRIPGPALASFRAASSGQLQQGSPLDSPLDCVQLFPDLMLKRDADRTGSARRTDDATTPTDNDSVDDTEMSFSTDDLFATGQTLGELETLLAGVAFTFAGVLWWLFYKKGSTPGFSTGSNESLKNSTASPAIDSTTNMTSLISSFSDANRNSWIFAPTILLVVLLFATVKLGVHYWRKFFPQYVCLLDENLKRRIADKLGRFTPERWTPKRRDDFSGMKSAPSEVELLAEGGSSSLSQFGTMTPSSAGQSSPSGSDQFGYDVTDSEDGYSSGGYSPSAAGSPNDGY
ncbi:unnamed protein product [Amoebophrya sp. A120]|nr:unnamed protein product [Amoebophrya sp. A120]|eukprot:GSA120T00012098001.1